MIERRDDFGGDSEEQILFNRAVQLELGRNMKVDIRCQVNNLFEDPVGIAHRESHIRQLETLFKEKAKLARCRVRNCNLDYAEKNGLNKHMAYNHIKQPDPSKSKTKVKVQDRKAYANQQFENKCVVEACFITYKEKWRLRTHLEHAHSYKPDQLRQLGLL